MMMMIIIVEIAYVQLIYVGLAQSRPNYGALSNRVTSTNNQLSQMWNVIIHII